MSANINILKDFINEFKETYSVKETVYENSLIGDVKKIQDRLLDEKFFPSPQLVTILNKQLKRARYPMEVAITGQFSAGKSTFLNALLSRNILPTGITPVTSKVNFINYGEEYKLKITYYSGATEFAPIESISLFTDQREQELKDIKYLTLYAPMDILKDISFVDTPGLNSQSQSDTDTTKRVLRDVGGIIWLTLIDNAGKLSEAEVLEEYMQNFKNKSLCVLNQKDKLTKEQVETTTKYVSEKFSKYFAKVVPISAMMALESRASHKDILLEDEYTKIVTQFKKELLQKDVDDLDFFEKNFKEYKTGWELPTGFLETFEDYCRNQNITLQVADLRVERPITGIKCSIKPKPEQKRVLGELLEKERAILEAKPGFGKTMAALLYYKERRQKTLVIVHTRSLLQQWWKRVEDYFTVTPEQLGVIGEGKWRVGEQITIASYQTLLSRGVKDIAQEFGLVIIDECHHVPAQTFTKVAKGFNAKYYLGLSATPFRKDKLDKLMNFYIGEIVASNEGGLREGELAFDQPAKNLVLSPDKTHLLIRQTKFYVENPDMMEYVQLGSKLVEDVKRNELIFRDVMSAVAQQGKILVLSERVAHCEYIYQELQHRLPDLKIGLITGQITKSEREEIFNDVRAGQYQALVATGSVIGEGFDWPEINHLFLTYPFSWKGKLIQYAGRAQRIAPGKKEAFIYDYVDGYVPMFKAMYRKRARAYFDLGIRPLFEAS